MRDGEFLWRCPWLRGRCSRPGRRGRGWMSSDSLGLEEFGVGEDDPELVVQAMEEQTQFGRFVHRSSR